MAKIDASSTVQSAASVAPPAAPLARGLSSWPAKPPAFDAVDASQIESASSIAIAGIESLGALIDRLTDCRVRANRHDSPDLFAQLNQSIKRPIDSVICSIMDVDPAACVQSAWAAQHAEDVVAAVSAIARACGASKRIIVLDERSPSRWWNGLRRAVKSADRAIRIVEIENDFPQADPSLMLYTLLNRRLKPSRLPTEVGSLLLDGVAAAALGAAVLRGQTMRQQPLCVRDHDRAESYFLVAPVGITARQILHRLALHPLGAPDTTNFTPQSIVRGGDVLRDRRVDLDAPLAGDELLLHVSTTPAPLNPDPCIRCGWCFEACPTRIHPADLLEAVQREDLLLAARAGLASCIECGICTYVCPSRLPILCGIRAIRAHERALEDEKVNP